MILLQIRDAVVEAHRPAPEASWRADVACPVCGLRPIRVRAYDASGDAWCAGRHDAPVGRLQHGLAPLRPLGMGEPETFRGRVYDATRGAP